MHTPLHITHSQLNSIDTLTAYFRKEIMKSRTTLSTMPRGHVWVEMSLMSLA
jgi:hypothetical protein